MKRMRILTLLLAILLITTLFAGCAKAPNKNHVGSAGDYYEGGNQKPESNLSGSTALSPDVADDRKLIRTVNLTAETEDMDVLLSLVAGRIAELGGYVESRDVYNGSQNSASNRQATLKIRIPADKMDAFITDVDGASNIVSFAESAEDVTMQYVATESHLKVLQAEEERLLQFLSEAKSVSEMLEIEKRLTDVRAELETVTNQLNTYANLVSYGTVHLRINEVKEYTVVEEEDPTLWQRISSGFVDGVKNVGKILEGLLVVVVSVFPYLVIPGIVVTIVLLAFRKAEKKKMKKTTPPKTE